MKDIAIATSMTEISAKSSECECVRFFAPLILSFLTKRSSRWHLTKIAQGNQSRRILHDSWWRSSWKSCRLSRGDFSCYKVQNYSQQATHVLDLIFTFWFFLEIFFHFEVSDLLGAWDLPECRKYSKSTCTILSIFHLFFKLKHETRRVALETENYRMFIFEWRSSKLLNEKKGCRFSSIPSHENLKILEIYCSILDVKNYLDHQKLQYLKFSH